MFHTFIRSFKNFPSFLIALFVFGSCNLQQDKSPPNILFIMADDHTSQAWGIYNGVLDEYVKNNGIKYLAEN